MSAKRVDFYFDYLSVYSYFGWLRLQEICDSRGVEIAIHPVLFAGLLNHWGQLGPAEIPPKREWVFRDAFRYATLHGIDLACPKYHPFNPLTALRLSLAEVAGADQRAVVNTIFRAGWSQGIDLGSPEEIGGALDAAGLPARWLLERSSQPEAKVALRKSTDLALERGVFGMPTTILEDELFWGNDRMHYVELALDGRDPIDREKIEAILGRSGQADRRAANAAKASRG